MANNYEISPNLIEQVQILLRKEAGVDSLNSNDHSLVDDSSQKSFLKEAIAGFKSSDDDVLLCKNCQGELLRGSESIICVYCGHARLHDVVHQPISFKSTFAFQWFLQSLNLDGFENVGEQIGGTESSYRGQNSFKKEEIPLSDFLDLQLKWADDDSSGFGAKNEKQLSGESYLSLVGVDVEEILAQDRKDHEVSSVSNEQAIASIKSVNEEHKISGEKNRSLFENMHSSGTASRSGEGGNDESVSDWGADFQSAFPGPGHEKPANFSVSGAFSGSNVTTSDISLGSNLETGPPLDSKVSDGNILVAGGDKAIESNASSESLPAGQQHTTKEDSPIVEKIDDDEDSFDEWGDFSMSRSDNISQSEPSTTAVPGTHSSGGLAISDPFDEFAGSAISKEVQFKNNNFTVPDDAWNNFTTPITGGGIQSQAISGKPEQHVGSGDLALGGTNDLALLDGISLGRQDFHVGSTQNKMSDLGDSFGFWSNDMHVGSSQLQGGESKSAASGTTNELDDSFNLWNDFTGADNQQQATVREVADNGISTGDDGIFNEWNDFAGFGVGKKEEQANSLEVVGGKGNGNQSDSLAFNAWNDFTASGGVSDSKPIGTDISSEAWNDFSSLMVTHTNRPQSSNTGTSDNQAVLEDDNLLSSLSDLRSLGTQTVNSLMGPNNSKTTSDQVLNRLKMVEDKTTLSAAGDFGGATSFLEQQLQASGAGSFENELNGGGHLFSGLNNDGKQSTNHSDNQIHGKTCENVDSFDVWSNFTSSSNAKAGISSSVSAPDDKEAFKHVDIFDAWDAIVSSPNMEAGKDTAVSMGKALEFNLSSPNINSQYVGTVSSMQPDLSVGMFSNQNGSAPVPFSPSQGSDMVRTEHGDAKAVSYVDRMNPSESTSKEIVAETLIAEMHDLSFMLESGLSIPKSGR